MQLEAQEKLPQAQKYYDHVLEGDETNIVRPAPVSLYLSLPVALENSLLTGRWCGNVK